MPENEEQSPNGGEQAKKPKVEFDQEQQTVLNGLINEAFAKAFAQASKQSETLINGLKTEISSLKAKVESTPEPKAETPKEQEKPRKTVAEVSEETSRLQAQIEEFRKIAEGLKKEREETDKRAQQLAEQNRSAQLKEAFIRASEKISFFDRMSEYSHMAEQLQLDEAGQVVVINPATKLPRLNSNAQQMTLEEFVADYAKQKPWTVKAPTTEVAGGSGSQETRKLDTTPAKAATKDWSKMSNEELLAEAESVIAKQYER